MSTTKHYRKLRGDGMCNWLCPTNMQAMMTACTRARQDRSGKITLTYTDGTEESRDCDKDMILEFDGFFPVVGYVQAGRAP